MLVVLSGAETINKTLLAGTITCAINSLTPPLGQSDLFYQQILNDNIENHLKMQFRAIFHDHGLTDGPMFPEGGNYAELLNKYKNRKYDHLVISGSFSKTFVNMISNDIEDLVVLNVTRNPSVAYLLDTINFDPLAPYNTNMGVPQLKKRFNTSAIQQAILKTVDTVCTIKFEDIISQGQITVAGKDIVLPDYYINHNGYITRQEQSKLTNEHRSITEFNQAYSNFNQVFPQYRDDVPLEIIPRLPINMFTALDYKPLEFNDIL